MSPTLFQNFKNKIKQTTPGPGSQRCCAQISTRAFKRLQKHRWQEAAFPAIGGLVTGISALGYPEVLYQGFGNVNAILQSTGSDYAPWLLLQIVGVKILCTAICKGSGLTGGIYAPSIFIGESWGLFSAQGPFKIMFIAT